jgi:hypothetical protein
MRTLIVSIADNDRAALIIRELAERQNLLGEDAEPTLTDGELMLELVEHVQMDAMVARPTLACHCGETRGAGKRTSGYAQSSNFKWWVHTQCNRPTSYIVNRWISNMLNGARDLLHDIVPSHPEVRDHLDRQARFRVGRQTLRESRKYTIPKVDHDEASSHR